MWHVSRVIGAKQLRVLLLGLPSRHPACWVHGQRLKHFRSAAMPVASSHTSSAAQEGGQPLQPAAEPAAQPASSQPAFQRLVQQARLTQIAQELWSCVCRPGDTVVDATCGNGHDTLCLARAVGQSGTVYAFDVQASAIAATEALLHKGISSEELPTLRLLQQSHATMQDVVGSGTARLVCFNLGYLPGSDKSVTTQPDSTLQAVHAACEVLQPGGLLSVLCYTGHAGGQEEFEAVKEVVAALSPSGWVSSQVQLLNRPTAPVLLLAWKQQLRG